MTKFTLVSVETHENTKWLSVRIPLPERKVTRTILVVVGLGLIAKIGLIAPEIVELVIRLITTGAP